MKLTGIIASSITAVIFLALVDLPLPEDLSGSGAAADWAMGLGIFIGAAVAGFIIDNVYIPKFPLSEQFAGHMKGARAGCLAGGLMGLPIAFILGVMFGGTLGGGVGSIIWAPLIPFGVCLGIFVVVVLVVTITSFTGAILGSAVQKAVKGRD